MNDKISRDEAIDRMKAGLASETFINEVAGWRETFWSDFQRLDNKFRKPSEPRRVAREWWIDGATFIARPGARNGDIHVREVLPGDVVVRKRTRDEWRELFGALYLPQLEELGLIGEGS